MALDLEDAPKTKLQLLPPDGFSPSQLEDWTNDLPVRRRRLGLAAAFVIFLVFGLGGVWGVTAQVGGVVTATGRVVAEDRNTVIQSLESGIIKSIKVKEGEVVRAGQLLATLDDSAVASQLRASKVQQALLTIELERWRAANNNAESFSFDLTQFGDIAEDPRVVGTLNSQTDEFNAARHVLERDLGRFDTQIASETADKASLAEALASYNAQMKSIQDELTGLQQLFADGLTTRQRMSSLQRTLAQLKAQVSDADAAVKKSDFNITAAEDQKESLILTQSRDASQNISRVQSSLNDVADQIYRQQDRIRRANMTSPIDGVVFQIKIKSEGAVLPAGQTFIEIVPTGGSLSIETMLTPRDIGDVHLGQEVDITFTSEQGKMVLPIKGIVEYVSTDSVVDTTTGASSYVVRSRVDAATRPVLPGNTAQVYFKVPSKTFLQYITQPVTQFALRSFSG